MRGRGPQGTCMSVVLINASYHDHQGYIWFMGKRLNQFQDTL